MFLHPGCATFCYLSLNSNNDLWENSLIEIISDGYFVAMFTKFINLGSFTVEIGLLSIVIISPSLLWTAQTLGSFMFHGTI